MCRSIWLMNFRPQKALSGIRKCKVCKEFLEDLRWVNTQKTYPKKLIIEMFWRYYYTYMQRLWCSLMTYVCITWKSCFRTFLVLEMLYVFKIWYWCILTCALHIWWELRVYVAKEWFINDKIRGGKIPLSLKEVIS